MQLRCTYLMGAKEEKWEILESDFSKEEAEEPYKIFAFHKMQLRCTYLIGAKEEKWEILDSNFSKDKPYKNFAFQKMQLCCTYLMGAKVEKLEILGKRSCVNKHMTPRWRKVHTGITASELRRHTHSLTPDASSNNLQMLLDLFWNLLISKLTYP